MIDDNKGPTVDILTGKLVGIIETHADDIAMNWYHDVQESAYLPGFDNLTQEQALGMATNVYRRLGYWLQPESDHEVQEAYENFGGWMCRKGFRLEEVVMALVLIKRYLWLHLLEGGVMTTNLEIYQALDLNNKVVLYFDRAIYFGLVGFKDAQEKQKAAKAY